MKTFSTAKKVITEITQEEFEKAYEDHTLHMNQLHLSAREAKGEDLQEINEMIKDAAPVQLALDRLLRNREVELFVKIVKE